MRSKSLLETAKDEAKTIDSIYRISVRKTGLKTGKNSHFPETKGEGRFHLQKGKKRWRRYMDLHAAALQKKKGRT